MDFYELNEIKQRNRAMIKSLPGVIVIGIGDNCLRIGIRDEKYREGIPKEIEGARVYIFITTDPRLYKKK
jgi:hypothetical protein